MVAQWDDVPWERAEHGEGLCWERQRLTPGLSRYRAAAGDRIMPVHVHVDEEEFVVVLAGGGMSWQDGRTYVVGAGDVILHRPDAETHTLIAGDEGLEVLIFASGSATGLTRLPRARVLRIGARLWPPDVGDAFAAEALGGALEVPEPAGERPPTITALADVPAEHTRRGRTDMAVQDVGEALGSTVSGIQREVIAPGAAGGGRWSPRSTGAPTSSTRSPRREPTTSRSTPRTRWRSISSTSSRCARWPTRWCAAARSPTWPPPRPECASC